jgi:hypothetical protein
LQLAISKLFVAQASKEQADKATQIVQLQTSSLARTSMFAGCNQQAYPTIAGSAAVKSSSSNSF